MSTPEKDLSAADLTRSKQGGDRRVWLLLGGAALALAIGTYLWDWIKAPRLPAVELAGVDSAIVTAVKQSQAAVYRSPQSAPAWGRLGMVLLAHDFTAQAMSCLAQAEQLDPREPRWPYFQGIILLKEDPEAAIAKLQQAVGLFGDRSPAARIRLGEALLAQDRFEEAEHQFRRVLKREPDNALAHLGLGRLAYRRGQLSESVEPLRQSIAKGGPRKTTHALLAEIHQRLGNQPAADEERRVAERLPEEYPPSDPLYDEVLKLYTGKHANLKRARQRLDLGRTQEAVKLLWQLVQDYPDAADGWLLLGKALVQQRELRDAQRALARAIELAPDDMESQVQMGVALFYSGDSQAANYFRRAVQLKPDSAFAHYNLGLCLMRDGDSAGAANSFRKAIGYQPDFTEAYAVLGATLSKQRQWAEALTYLRRAVQLNPDDRKAKEHLQQVLGQIPFPTGP
jgi:tetratricopeptide (TPR) repeat protein